MWSAKHTLDTHGSSTGRIDPSTIYERDYWPMLSSHCGAFIVDREIRFAPCEAPALTAVDGGDDD